VKFDFEDDNAESVRRFQPEAFANSASNAEAFANSASNAGGVR